MKEFFNITESKYRFELMDLFTIITIVNVIGILIGWYYAPIIGLFNCLLNIIYNVKTRSHINSYVMQTALIILNAYFLTL